MNQSMHDAGDDALTRLSGGLTSWVLGLGLLSLHATIFTISMVGMVLWNIYDTPRDLWVDEVFYRWAAVLIFHAIAVACGWTAWRLMRSEQAAVIAAQRTWSPAPTQPAEFRTYEPPRLESNGWHGGAPAHGGRMQRYAESAHRAEDAAKRALASSAAWSSTMARRTMSVMSTTATKLTHRIDNSDSKSAADPTQTWPENPARHRPEDEEFISRFAGSAATTPGEGTTRAPETGTGTDIVLNVSGISSRPETELGSTPHLGKGPGQTWIEAATSVWHGPHQSNGSSSDHRQNEDRDGSGEPNAPTQ